MRHGPLAGVSKVDAADQQAASWPVGKRRICTLERLDQDDLDLGLVAASAGKYRGRGQPATRPALVQI